MKDNYVKKGVKGPNMWWSSYKLKDGVVFKYNVYEIDVEAR